ncbi:MAG TPA: PEP-CTERM sorting domain-containing protein [Candidatus Acidoferrales bacterium]|nr:PEP-CTERM sorting domain-containing protein [Candidatus Acidoferrales bacterium]
MKRFALYVALIAAFLVLSSGAAIADTLLQYTLTGPDSYTASWTLSQTPTVITSVPDTGPITVIGEGYFEAEATDFTVNGSTPDNQDLAFFLEDQLGGVITTPNFSTLNFYGPQLFSGPLDSPTMLTSGTTPFVLDIGDGTNAYSLTVSDAVATPEPSSLLLLGLGIAGLALVTRRRAIS